MSIRFQTPQRKVADPRVLLRWARNFFTDRDHFMTGGLFDNGYDPLNAEKCCALGAIRKGYVELYEDDYSDYANRDWYEDVPDVVAEADRLLAQSLAPEKLAEGHEPINVIYSTNDQWGGGEGKRGYDSIIEGLDQAIKGR